MIIQDTATEGLLKVEIYSGCNAIVGQSELMLRQASSQICRLARCLDLDIHVDTQLLQSESAPQLFRVKGSITTDAIVQEYLELLSEQEIVLQPGFEVNLQDELKVQIEACVSAFRQEGEEKD